MHGWRVITVPASEQVAGSQSMQPSSPLVTTLRGLLPALPSTQERISHRKQPRQCLCGLQNAETKTPSQWVSSGEGEQSPGLLGLGDQGPETVGPGEARASFMLHGTSRDLTQRKLQTCAKKAILTSRCI